MLAIETANMDVHSRRYYAMLQYYYLKYFPVLLRRSIQSSKETDAPNGSGGSANQKQMRGLIPEVIGETGAEGDEAVLRLLIELSFNKSLNALAFLKDNASTMDRLYGMDRLDSTLLLNTLSAFPCADFRSCFVSATSDNGQTHALPQLLKQQLAGDISTIFKNNSRNSKGGKKKVSSVKISGFMDIKKLCNCLHMGLASENEILKSTGTEMSVKKFTGPIYKIANFVQQVYSLSETLEKTPKNAYIWWNMGAIKDGSVSSVIAANSAKAFLSLTTKQSFFYIGSLEDYANFIVAAASGQKPEKEESGKKGYPVPPKTQTEAKKEKAEDKCNKSSISGAAALSVLTASISPSQTVPILNPAVAGLDIGEKSIFTLSLPSTNGTDCGITNHISIGQYRRLYVCQIIGMTSNSALSRVENEAIAKRMIKVYDNYIAEDASNKLISALCSNGIKYIGIEDSMVNKCSEQNKHNAKLQGHNMFFSVLMHLVEIKLRQKGIEVIPISAFNTTKICSACGNHFEDKDFQGRMAICPKCGLKMDRDENASDNILYFANQAYKDIEIEAV